MNKRHKAKPKGWLITALISAAMVAYAVFIFLPKQKTTNAMRSQLREYQQFVLQSDGLAAAEVDLQRSSARTREHNQQWRAAAPSRNRLAPFVQQVTIAASESNVDIVRLTPQAAKEFDSVARIPIVIESRGGFGELIAFIQKLEQLPAAVWVDDLHISAPAQKAGQEGELNCELTLAVFADNRDNSG